MECKRAIKYYICVCVILATALVDAEVAIVDLNSLTSLDYDVDDFGDLGDPVEGEPFESEYPTCKGWAPDGSLSVVPYDDCTSFCCGGNVITNRTNVDCCGSMQNGSPYNTRSSKCCEWWTGHGRGHPKRAFRIGLSCCGTDLINWSTGSMSCCYGSLGPPQVFNWRRDLCCDSRRIASPTRDPNFSACCGKTAGFDRRRQSCPCNDGTVLNVVEQKAECCENEEGLKAAYNIEKQICCNGKVGDKSKQFCCLETDLGTIGESVCCAEGLKNTTNTTETECCDGTPFNPSTHLCCDDLLIPIRGDATECCGKEAYDPEERICCGNTTTWSREMGDECCGRYVFFKEGGQFCCNEEVQIADSVGGDACCGEGIFLRYYYKDDGNFICCNGILGYKAKGDQCCNQSPFFDDRSICCDGEVFDRELGDSCCNGSPYFKSRPSDKEKTICCANGPYGPFKTPACCKGQGYDIQGGTVCCGQRVYGVYSTPSCCVDKGYDVTTHQCCGGVIVKNPTDVKWAQCCGSYTFNHHTQICCEGTNITVPAGIPISRAKCCGVYSAYDPVTQLCCSGVRYNKLNRYYSQCCGEDMYDTREEICCGDNQDLEPNEDGSYDIDTLPTLYPLADKNKKTTKCCGKNTYDTDKSVCCCGYIEDKLEDNADCCLCEQYDRSKQICCEDELQTIGPKVPWQRAACCGGKCMFEGKQRCCKDRIYKGNALSTETCENYGG